MSIPETAAGRIEAMRKVLLHIQGKKSLEELTFEERRILKECYDAKYFEGIVLSEMASGKIVWDYRFEPQLTLAGLQFLDSSKNQNYNQKPVERNAAHSHKTSPKKFYKSSVFWNAVCGIAAIVTIVVTILIHRSII